MLGNNSNSRQFFDREMKIIYYLLRFSYDLQQWLVRRFTVSGIGLLCCLVAAIVMGLDTKQTMAYQIFTFLVAILLIAIACSWRFRDRFSLSRTLPKFATAGVKLRYAITIDNRTHKIQQGLKITENFADPRPSIAVFSKISKPHKNRRSLTGKYYYPWSQEIARNRKAKIKTIDLPTLLPRSKTKAILEIEPLHRGITRLTGMTIARPDPLNIFNACQTISLPQSLLILPKRYKLPAFQLPGGRKSQSGGTALISSVGDSEEFVSLREYRPGDPLRKIHWKSWAKTDKPIVKEEQEEYFVRHALILDTFGDLEYSEIQEEAIAVAASFACDIRSQESLLDMMFVGSEAYGFTAGRGSGNTEKMLEILAGVTACRDKPFVRLTNSVMSRASMLSGCICVLIDWDEDRKQLVNYLQSINVPTFVFVVTDKAATEPDFTIDNLHWLELGKIQEGLMAI